MSLFDGLITSKMRVRILMRLFLNPDQQVYIRELADEMQVSPSQVSDELKKLSESDLLHAKKVGRQINFSANQAHPLYPELHSMVKKSLGMDRILDSILERLGNVEKILLLDDYAMGKDTGIIDLVLVGKIDKENLDDIVNKTEKYLKRKIRTLILSLNEYLKLEADLRKRPMLELWNQNNISS